MYQGIFQSSSPGISVFDIHTSFLDIPPHPAVKKLYVIGIPETGSPMSNLQILNADHPR
jgi:hypothetical protein